MAALESRRADELLAQYVPKAIKVCAIAGSALMGGWNLYDVFANHLGVLGMFTVPLGAALGTVPGSIAGAVTGTLVAWWNAITRRRLMVLSSLLCGLLVWCVVQLWSGWAYHTCGGKYRFVYEQDPYATVIPATLYPGC